MAFQLFAILFCAYLLGKFLDDKAGTKEPYITMGILVLAIFGYLYSLIRQTSVK